jgi:hypothetical protein
MGHSGEGIRVIGWLEAVGRARGRDSVNRGRGQTVGGGGRRGRQGRPLVREWRTLVAWVSGPRASSKLGLSPLL